MPNTGKIKQIIGPVVDVHFDGKLPEIYNALEITRENGQKVVLEFSSTLVKIAFVALRWILQMVSLGECW